MGFLSSLFSGIVSIGASFVGVTINLVSDFKDKVIETVYNLQTNHDNLKKDLKNEFSKTKDINDEIFEYRDKYLKDKKLTEADKERIKGLKKQRETISDNINDLKENSLAVDLANDSSSYENITIQDSNLHILQYHVGKSVLGKTCNKCGLPMLLQWKVNKKVNKLSDFFWGCSGFYFEKKCINISPFRQVDYNLITKSGLSEFSITNNELNSIIDYGNSSKIIDSRLNNIINEKNEDYLCPIHHEPLILKEKKYSIGLLDSYFLSCPRWLPNKQGCNYIVKLKSPAQLASVLEQHTGRGIL